MDMITLAEIKQNARVENNLEDELITLYGDVAEQTVLNLCNRDLESLYNEYGAVPTPVKYACIMLATHLYEHRTPTTGVSIAEVPYTFDAMVKPYVKLSHV